MTLLKGKFQRVRLKPVNRAGVFFWFPVLLSLQLSWKKWPNSVSRDRGSSLLPFVRQP